MVQGASVDVSQGAGPTPKKPSSDEPRFTIERVESPVDPLSEQPGFCGATTAFCGIRLLRLVLLSACFPDGPHTEDGAATLGITCSWLAVVNALIGALLLFPPIRQWAEEQVFSPRAVWYTEPFALVLLAAAVTLDLLHQFIAMVRWDYFWGTGVMRDESQDSKLLAYVLILLHVIGLLGLVMMVAAYARCYRASYRAAWKGPPPEVKWHRDAGPDLESGRGDSTRSTNSKVGSETHAQAWSSSKKWTCPFCEERNNESRTQCNNCGKVRPPDVLADHEAASKPARTARPSASSTSAPASSAGPRTAGSAPNPAPTMGTAEPRPSVGTPPRAWLWMDDVWHKVRIMRSSADGNVAVRLPGGAVVNTRQFLLRPRCDGDEPPPSEPPPTRSGSSPPPSASAAGRPRQASKQSGQGGSRRSSKASATDAAERLGSAGDSASTAAKLSAEEQWAAERMARLRKELQALDGKSPAERRSGLRALQRELHPDKQPPELRVHAQPLFMLVQKEWEVEEATRTAAAEAAEA